MSMHSDQRTANTRAVRYGDGRSAAARTAMVSPGEDGLWVAVENAPAELWRYADLQAATPVHRGDTSMLLTSRGHAPATLLIDDAGMIATIAGRAPQLTAFASRWRAAWPGLIVGGIAAGIVALVYLADLQPAKAVARVLPHSVMARIGDGAVASMMGDRKVCTQAAGRAALARFVARIDPGRESGADRVTVVDMSLVNAFAAPGGRVVLTRGIIARVGSADELAGVLAHEIGHTEELHPEAGLVRGLGFWALLSVMFTGQPSTIGNAGAILAQLSYTRTAEREADAIALAKLKAAGISARPFADFFRRLAAEEGKSKDPIGRALRTNELLSTHPATAERIARIEAAPAYPSTPALSAEDWQALRAICGKSRPAKTPSGG